MEIVSKKIKVPVIDSGVCMNSIRDKKCRGFNGGVTFCGAGYRIECCFCRRIISFKLLG